MTRLRTVALALVVLALVSARPAAAAEEGTGTYPRREAPFVLRTEVHLIYFSLSNADGFVALTGAYSVSQFVAVEASGGIGLGNTNVKDDTGGHFMLAARLAGSFSANHRHALTVAAGPMLMVGGAYGRVALLHGEAGYEYRRARGVTLLLAAGLSTLLQDSAVPTPTGSCSGSFTFCPTRLEAGATGMHLRAGLGISF
jgi:hypothetical protein